MKKLISRARPRRASKQHRIIFKINRKRFLKALESSFGNVSAIAQRLGKSTSSVYAYLREAPEDIKELFQLERERMYDVAEKTVVEMALQRIHFPELEQISID